MRAQAPGRLERLAGWASFKLIAFIARRAKTRGDTHELLHCVAALEAGDSSHAAGSCDRVAVARLAVAEISRRGETS